MLRFFLRSNRKSSPIEIGNHQRGGKGGEKSIIIICSYEKRKYASDDHRPGFAPDVLGFRYFFSLHAQRTARIMYSLASIPKKACNQTTPENRYRHLTIILVCTYTDNICDRREGRFRLTDSISTKTLQQRSRHFQEVCYAVIRMAPCNAEEGFSLMLPLTATRIIANSTV